MDLNALAAVLLFAALALAIVGGASALAYRRQRRSIVARIHGLGRAPQPAPAQAQNGAQGGALQRLVALAATLGLKWGGAPSTEGEISHRRRLFLQAGFRREHALAAFVGFKLMGAALFAGGGILWRVAARPGAPAVAVLLVIVGAALFGWYLPDIVLRLRIMHRQELMMDGFPDALDLMVVCVEAGMGLDAALTRVGEEMRLRSRTLSDEFRLLSLELRAGKMRRDALHNLAARTGLEEISSFVSLLVQTDRFGTSVAQALRVHSDSMRIKRSQRAEEIAAKLPVKLVFPLVLFIFPSIFVVVVGPAIIKLYRSLITVVGQ
jgi:tight adherence protein C